MSVDQASGWKDLKGILRGCVFRHLAKRARGVPPVEVRFLSFAGLHPHDFAFASGSRWGPNCFRLGSEQSLAEFLPPEKVICVFRSLSFGGAGFFTSRQGGQRATDTNLRDSHYAGMNAG